MDNSRTRIECKHRRSEDQPKQVNRRATRIGCRVGQT